MKQEFIPQLLRLIVAERKSFLLRIDPAVLNAIQQWASDDLRSLNGQIEFLLRKAIRDAGRPAPKETAIDEPAENGSAEGK